VGTVGRSIGHAGSRAGGRADEGERRRFGEARVNASERDDASVMIE